MASLSAVEVPEKDLPVKLPEDVTFDKPGNPLDHHPTWKNVNCPACAKPARRETDTFDKLSEPQNFAQDDEALTQRRSLIQALVDAERTSIDDVAEAVEAFRRS